MAKRSRPGAVKSRLIRGGYPPDAAAAVHDAMLRCVLARLPLYIDADFVLALGGEGAEPSSDAIKAWSVVEQGEGDLGDRLDRVWQAVGRGAVAFFGVDSPDVPGAALRGVFDHHVALGPTPDGGYWTLASDEYRPSLLRGIDWGSERVFDQTVAAARAAGIEPVTLPTWGDVDEPADVEALRSRLSAATPADAPLRRLLLDLDTLTTETRRHGEEARGKPESQEI